MVDSNRQRTTAFDVLTKPVTLLVGHWLMAWGEAFSTGMLVAIFVAFKPQWLATWSDSRYLPKD